MFKKGFSPPKHKDDCQCFRCTKISYNKGKKFPERSGEKHPGWKGDKAGYLAIHAWVQRRLGKPNKCVECGTATAKKFEWANISGKYKRNVKDFRRLCTSCHRKEGYQKGEWIPWLKGTKGMIKPNLGSFKKGHIPWNKGG